MKRLRDERYLAPVRQNVPTGRPVPPFMPVID